MNLRVLIATDRNERAALIEQALAPAHHEVIARIAPDDDLVAYVQQARPDALVLDVQTLGAGLLRRLERLLRQAPLPVTVFAERSDRETIQAAVKAGVSAFVVNGFSPARVLPVLAAACTRFGEFQALRRERDAAIRRLAERKLIERAKGIVMKQRACTEAEAYRALRKMAMDRGKRLAEVAETLVTAEDLLARS